MLMDNNYINDNNNNNIMFIIMIIIRLVKITGIVTIVFTTVVTAFFNCNILSTD